MHQGIFGTPAQTWLILVSSIRWLSAAITKSEEGEKKKKRKKKEEKKRRKAFLADCSSTSCHEAIQLYPPVPSVCLT